MEGVGSRLGGRSSSRYGTTTPGSTTTTLPAFTGPVRKWRRQWVSSEPQPTTNNNNNRGKNQLQHQDAKPLLLCRWIPVPRTASGDSDLPPKRKVRYAPVTVLEELKKEACRETGVDAKKVKESEANRTERSAAVAAATATAFGKSHNTDAFLQDMKELMMGGQAQVNQLFLDKF